MAVVKLRFGGLDWEEGRGDGQENGERPGRREGEKGELDPRSGLSSQ